MVGGRDLFGGLFHVFFREESLFSFGSFKVFLSKVAW
jgi:hypothetical protein